MTYTYHLEQYEIQIKKSGTWVAQTCYGQLTEILVCKIPNNNHNLWGKLTGSLRLLAVITPYRTGGKDAALEIVQQFQPMAPIVADIQSVMAVVGRVQTRDRWYLIDRTGGMVRPEFIPGDEEEEEDE